MEFDNPDEPFPRGCRAAGHSLSRSRAHKALTSRLRLGGTYSAQRARAGPAAGAEDFTIQDAQATVSYQLGPTLSMEGGLGVSHLALPRPNGARTGPGRPCLDSQADRVRPIHS